MKASFRKGITIMVGTLVPPILLLMIMAVRWYSVDHACTLQLPSGGCDFRFPSNSLLLTMTVLALAGVVVTRRLTNRHHE